MIVMEITEITRSEATALLTEWHDMVSDRDRRILTARKAGLTTVTIAGLMHISPNTISTVLARAAARKMEPA